MCSQVNFVRGVLIRASLLLLLVGCSNLGSGQQGTISTKQRTQSHSSAQKGFDIAGLLHVEPSGFICSQALSTGFLFSQGNLVLSQNRFTYDSGELQQMTTYVQALDKTLSAPGSVSMVPDISIPTTLRWEQVAQAVSTKITVSSCMEKLELTNIGSNVIQIQSIYLQLISSQKNNAQYHLIDACPLLTTSEQADCPPHLGGGPQGEYRFEMQPSPNGTELHPSQTLQVSPSTLQPKALLDIQLSISSRYAFMYTVIPELIFNDHTVKLQQITSQVSFATQNQFPCYTLEDGTFVEITENKFLSHDPWCI